MRPVVAHSRSCPAGLGGGVWREGYKHASIRRNRDAHVVGEVKRLRGGVATRFGRGGGKLDIWRHAATASGGVEEAWCVRSPRLPRSGPDSSQHHDIDIAVRETPDQRLNNSPIHTSAQSNPPCPHHRRRRRSGSSTSTPHPHRNQRIHPSPIRPATRHPSRARNAPYRRSSQHGRHQHRRRWTRSR
jgi:hypothetical protein